MIDLHCHLLPGVDDGASNLEQSLAMARMAAEDGVSTVACTPHVMPGVYNNGSATIYPAVARLQQALDENKIDLTLVVGGDVHLAPNLLSLLRSGEVPTLNGSRYFLFEPPHQVLPPRLHESLFDLLVAGYVPILTHPERLKWIEGNFHVIKRLAEAGVWMQLTAGSVTGGFGRRSLYWSERMLDEGMVQILATDAHDTRKRPLILSHGYEAAERRLGAAEAARLVYGRPLAILNDVPSADAMLGGAPSASARPAYVGGGDA